MVGCTGDASLVSPAVATPLRIWPAHMSGCDSHQNDFHEAAIYAVTFVLLNRFMSIGSMAYVADSCSDRRNADF